MEDAGQLCVVVELGCQTARSSRSNESVEKSPRPSAAELSPQHSHAARLATRLLRQRKAEAAEAQVPRGQLSLENHILEPHLGARSLFPLSLQVKFFNDFGRNLVTHSLSGAHILLSSPNWPGRATTCASSPTATRALERPTPCWAMPRDLAVERPRGAEAQRAPHARCFLDLGPDNPTCEVQLKEVKEVYTSKEECQGR